MKQMSEVQRSMAAEEKQRRIRNIRQARRWRRSRFTYQEIADALHVSIMTAWLYCRGVQRRKLRPEGLPERGRRKA